MTSVKKELLLEKHIDFIVNYGKTHDKYVSKIWTVLKLKMFKFIC